MITRTHVAGDTRSVAVYSSCERYRFTLTRVWDPAGGKVLFIMLNPSTATELQNDPTVERCERRARALGYGAFRVCNIFGWRATDPKQMRAAGDPIGPQNDEAISEGCAWAGEVICAWGTHGAHLDRGAEVTAMLHRIGVQPKVLGLTKNGTPKHPLYIGYAQQPVEWDIAEAAK